MFLWILCLVTMLFTRVRVLTHVDQSCTVTYLYRREDLLCMILPRNSTEKNSHARKKNPRR